MEQISNVDLALYTDDETSQFSTQFQHAANRFAATLFNDDITSFVPNAKAHTAVIHYDDEMLLATITNKEYANTHLCSPYSLYVGCAKETVHSFRHWWMRSLIHVYTQLFGGLFKLLQINKVVHINNMICASILHPRTLPAKLPKLINTVTTKYPHHAIFLPCFNPRTDPCLFNTVQTHDFVLIPTKTVHIYDPQRNYIKKSHTRRDLSLLRNSHYTIVQHNEISAEDLVRIKKLYEMLFIRKHSKHNPHLTLKYFIHCHRHRWYEFIALRSASGSIDAFITQAQRDGMMICGPLGYDTAQPQKLGLYRMIIAASLRNAHVTQCIYNFGSRNEQFKLNRGSIREMEYNAVYIKHLPFYRRLPWYIIAWSGKYISTKLFAKKLI